MCGFSIKAPEPHNFQIAAATFLKPCSVTLPPLFSGRLPWAAATWCPAVWDPASSSWCPSSDQSGSLRRCEVAGLLRHCDVARWAVTNAEVSCTGKFWKNYKGWNDLLFFPIPSTLSLKSITSCILSSTRTTWGGNNLNSGSVRAALRGHEDMLNPCTKSRLRKANITNTYTVNLQIYRRILSYLHCQLGLGEIFNFKIKTRSLGIGQEI